VILKAPIEKDTMAYDASDYVDQALWDLIDLLEQALTPTFLSYLEQTYGKKDWPRAVAQKQPWTKMKCKIHKIAVEYE
jgi:hypothetical protein